MDNLNNTLPVHHLFEAQAIRTPDQPALVYHDKQLTYKLLNEKADQLAFSIAAQSPASTLIGVSATRSIDTIISVLSILKAGKAYLPLDTGLPKERLEQIIKDSGIDTCLCLAAEKESFNDLPVKTIYSDAAYEITSQPLQTSGPSAYVLYTSGSTGVPKGVEMGHAALVNLLEWQKVNSLSAPGFNTLQFAPLTFDVSFQEIFATLTTGGTLILVSEEMRVEPGRLLLYIEANNINRIFLPFVVLQYLTEAAAADSFYPGCLKEVMTAGEQLKITPQVRQFFEALPGTVLYNQYGPTETHVVTQLALTGKPALWSALPNIGTPIANTGILILDDNLKETQAGTAGELCVSGLSLANGYLNRPDLTAEKFITIKKAGIKNTRVYRTGDLAKYLPDGNIEYLGRIDTQVKIRGNRVEPAEIEVLINELDEIKQAVVIAREDAPGQKRLVAYLIASGINADTVPVRSYLEQRLPDYMLPSAYVWLNSFPETSSGKVDRKALPPPDIKRPQLNVLYKAPVTATEKKVAEIWGELLLINGIGTGDNFFDLGGNSLMALKAVALLKSRYAYTEAVTKLYQYPTIVELANHLDGKIATAVSKPLNKKSEKLNKDIAIIGIAGRFPGANDLDEFWRVLSEGKETTSFFSENEIDNSVPAEVRNSPAYVKARGVLEDADKFDASFFGFNPRSAELMDPQQRIFLELAWEVLENSGHLPQKYNGSVGVFAGCGYNTYFTNNVFPNPKITERAGQFNVRLLNEKDYIATRTAYQLNLTGPAVAVYSACSTSLLAVAQAVNSIREGQCDVALAGAVAVTSPVNSGHLYEEGSIMSRDGHCRPFDAEATGTVFSDGGGVVLLKGMDDALSDGDTIYAVIKGIGLNNDGGGKGSFGGPSAAGQAGAIAMAIADADADPADISYIEAHGTATPIGDPIEIEGLKLAFNIENKKQFCAVGSVKSNFGHLTAASGIAGLIKTVLSMRNRQIPASLFYYTPNPAIDFTDSPFYVNSSLTAWKSTSKRLAGVSSFGVGGTNVHVVLEEYPQAAQMTVKERPLSLITLSAKTEASLDSYAEKLALYTEQNKDVSIADVACTLQTTRANFNHRRFMLAADIEDLSVKLRDNRPEAWAVNHLSESLDSVTFMFPGQGAQFLNMGRDLYKQELVYKTAVDNCVGLLTGTPHENITQVLYPNTADEEASAELNNTFYTQPAIFITEYAIAQLWISWGVQPAILVGHSVGEFVAACLAGVFSLKDALLLISARARLVSESPEGSMLAVRMEAGELGKILPEKLSIAVVNSKKLCVVAGDKSGIQLFSSLLADRNIPARLLQTSHAFHSSMMDGLIMPFAEIVKTVKLNPPVKPVISTVTGTWLTSAEATSIAYWANHLRDTVQFAKALDTLHGEKGSVLLEVGPGNTLSTLARQQFSSKTIPIISGIETQDGYNSVLRAVGQLWLNGIEPDWKAIYGNGKRLRLSLPAYAFEKKRYWLEPPAEPESKEPEIIPAEFKTDITAQQILMKKQELTQRLKTLFEDASGIEIDGPSAALSFIELGFDSLLLTQIATNLKKEFAVPITFRKLFEDYNSIDLLAGYIVSMLPETSPTDALKTGTIYTNTPGAAITNAPASPLDALSAQIQMLAGELARLKNGNHAVQENHVPVPVAPPVIMPRSGVDYDLSPEEQVEVKKPFGATARIEKQVHGLNETQRNFLDELTDRYNKKTAGSKAYTQEHRSYMADPRVVSGFRPLTKEVVYPVVVNRSKGSRVWDIDGNEYIDALNGFGSSFLGYQPDVVKQAVLEQIEAGYEIGPQHELAGEVCRMICDFTNFDRAALCNTGSEAVLGAMRIARTVTGRSLIIAFSGSYHGINDEVIVRGTKKLKTIPAAPGIMPEVVQNMLILDYGTDESLEIIRTRAHEAAAILVEPVQSRRPDFQPVEFLKKVRAIATDSETVLIFDEVITGFRMHPGGAQAMFNIKADLGTYGKVIGGGMPIGAIAGIKKYMDALDGGNWEYGDNSTPEAGVTYFAGTFVRHPLALAASKASLLYMKQKGLPLQHKINSLTRYLATELNAICEEHEIPLYVPSFGSLWKIKFKDELLYGELLFTLMREKGIHIWDLFPCFLTEAHTKEEVDAIIKAFKESVTELVEAGFMPGKQGVKAVTKEEFNPFMESPFPGARLGRDKDGNPGWFINDLNNPGRYLQVK